jgi:hypothetical protein
MSFAAPWFLLGGAIAALAVVALHFLVRRQPERWQLPTTRFVPETNELAPARSLELSDRLLLALRVLAVTMAALAFARPSFDAARVPLMRVIVEDRSSAVADTSEVTRAAAEGDRVVRMDSGSVSAALLRAIREARALRAAADSVAIVLVSPLAREQLDAATPAIRAVWPGGIELRRVAARTASPELGAVALRAPADDPLRATLALSGLGIRDAAPVRLVRDAMLSSADSAWAREAGHVLVHWPGTQGPARDTTGALVTPGTVLVASFARSVPASSGTAVAWWADGAVAATESVLGDGCVRTVSVPVTGEGDLALRERFRRVVHDLLGPCGGARDVTPADSAAVRMITGSAPVAVATSALPPHPDAGRAAMPWLLALALLFLVAEQLVRRRGER